MKLSMWCLSLLALVAIVPPVMADGTNNAATDTNRLAELKSYVQSIKLAQGLKYQHGLINLPDGVATINLPTNICYLNPDDADIVLVKIWHNPPSPKTLGMLLPANRIPTESGCWAITITSIEDGYVKDDEAVTINYADLLKQMQAGASVENQERAAHGFPTVDLVGWAEPPSYDATTHKLHWAQELKFTGETQDTLNYDLRILGRHGVLVLRAVAGMNELQEIHDETPKLLAAVDFTAGNRYADFDPKVDKVAAYGIATLVTGETEEKPGFSKPLLIGLLILIVVPLVAARVKRSSARHQNLTAQP